MRRYYKYKRGQIIYANIPKIEETHEQRTANWHYCIVINNNDLQSKESVVVIPLTSKPNKNRLNLGNELSKALEKNFIRMRNNYVAEQVRMHCEHPADFTNEEIEKIIESGSPEGVRVAVDYIKKAQNKINRMLENTTFARIDRITSIHKSLIRHPINSLDPLKKAYLSDNALDLIDSALLKCLFKKSTNIDK